MKKTILHSCIVIALLVAMSCSNKSGAPANGQKDSTNVTTNSEVKTDAKKKYGIKSAIVTYKTETMGMKNSQMLYFDDFGAKEATYTITELELMGQKSRKVNVEMIKDGFRYSFELENKINGVDKTVKEVRKEAISSSAITGSSYAYTAMTEEIKKEYEYKDEGKETVAGVEGNKFSLKMGKTRMTGVVYNNVMLKTVMDMITITAEKFEEGASIPADKFEIPADYKVVEMK